MSKINIDSDGTEHTVWIDPDDREFSGLIIGSGPTRSIAIAEAIMEVTETLEKLRRMQIAEGQKK